MIEHMQVTADTISVTSVWASAIVVEEIDPLDDTKRYPGLNVQCKDRVKRAGLGDYIIKHSDGSFDVLGPAMYRLRYAEGE